MKSDRKTNGLPVGIQIVAPLYQDQRLFACTSDPAAIWRSLKRASGRNREVI